MRLPFADREDAGRALADAVQRQLPRTEVVLALPRGGVPVGFEVAQALGVPLDVFVVRKLGAPGHEELAMGALASGGTRVMNSGVLDTLRVPASAVERVVEREAIELERRERAYRGDRPPQEIAGRHLLLVDDGLATGASMRAAVAGVRERDPASVAVAVPVAAVETCDELRREVDHLLCLATPEPFIAVGLWYRDFRATTDEQVRDLLARSHSQKPTRSR